MRIIFLMSRSSLFLSLLILTYSCNTTTPKTIAQMEFNVDSSIVDRSVSDSLLGIAYAVPSVWQTIEASDEALTQARSGTVRISNMLRNAAGSVVFSLTDVRNVQDSVFRSLDETFKTILNPTGNWTNVQRDEFTTAGYNVKQYVMSKQGQVFFKMIFDDRKRPLFQIDYNVIIDTAYKINTKTLESIIGSLHRAR